MLRPLLFRLPADTAHDLGKTALRWPAPWRLLAGAGDPDPRLATDLGGLALTSPIGLAPGFDKRGDLVPALVELGFGYVVVGSITAAPRAGNPKPRLHRDPERQSLTNCMGMPNPGIDEAVRLLARPRRTGAKVLAAIAGTSVEEAVRLAATVEPHVDAVEVGLVCRHSPETFEMAELPTVTAILEGVGRQKTKPTFVKIPPHHSAAERGRTLAIVDACIANGIEGVSISGTQQIPDPALSMGVGGLAGKATTDDALRILGDVAERAAGRLAIKASGGIFDGADAVRFLEAGASAIEVYSAFIYRGPRVARQIGRELARLLEARGVASVRDIRPAPVPADRVAASA